MLAYWDTSRNGASNSTKGSHLMTGSPVRDSLHWRKSSFSAESNCVEMAALPDGTVAMRDSREADNVFKFTRAQISAFLRGVKAGEFDDLG